MLMIGTNNTRRNYGGGDRRGRRRDRARTAEVIFPTRRFCCSASSRAGAPADPVRATIAEINRTISKLHDGTRVHYLDIGAEFLDADGNIPQDVMSDGLHPSTKGYEIWAEAVNEPLTALMAGR